MPAAAERLAGLFERTHQPLLAYALRRVTDPADAADVVADTFLVAWRRLDAIPGDNERAWLFGVARKVLGNHNRGTRRRHAAADRLRWELTTEPQVSLPNQPTTALARALDQLSEPDRELLRLVAWEELSNDEVAVVLGISTGAVRVRLHRARQRLQALLAGLERVEPADDPATGTAATATASASSRRTR